MVPLILVPKEEATAGLLIISAAWKREKILITRRKDTLTLPDLLL